VWTDATAEADRIVALPDAEFTPSSSGVSGCISARAPRSARGWHFHLLCGARTFVAGVSRSSAMRRM